MVNDEHGMQMDIPASRSCLVCMKDPGVNRTRALMLIKVSMTRFHSHRVVQVHQ